MPRTNQEPRRCRLKNSASAVPSTTWMATAAADHDRRCCRRRSRTADRRRSRVVVEADAMPECRRGCQIGEARAAGCRTAGRSRRRRGRARPGRAGAGSTASRAAPSRRPARTSPRREGVLLAGHQDGRTRSRWTVRTWTGQARCPALRRMSSHCVCTLAQAVFGVLAADQRLVELDVHHVVQLEEVSRMRGLDGVGGRDRLSAIGQVGKLRHQLRIDEGRGAAGVDLVLLDLSSC